MIKVNLLNSVTERQGGAVVAVDRKVGSPKSRMLLMIVSVCLLTAAVISWDVISTQMALAEAKVKLEEQKKIQKELEEVMKEQKDLEQKIQNIDLRIDAIKKLRESQAGPSAVLEAIRDRISMVPALYIESVEQTGDQVTIKGNSPDESAVTQFGRSLEFSSGLFSNLSIETQRKEVQNQQVSASANPDAPKLEIVNFIIRCAYTPSKANAPKDMTASAAQPQANPGGASQSDSAAPAQVAKKQN